MIFVKINCSNQIKILASTILKVQSLTGHLIQRVEFGEINPIQSTLIGTTKFISSNFLNLSQVFQCSQLFHSSNFNSEKLFNYPTNVSKLNTTFKTQLQAIQLPKLNKFRFIKLLLFDSNAPQSKNLSTIKYTLNLLFDRGIQTLVKSHTNSTK